MSLPHPEPLDGVRPPVPVVVPRRRALQPGVGGIGVVVHHVHNHPHTVFVEGLDHLLALPDADRPIRRVGGVAALGHVVVHGVVAPVELAVIPVLVHRAEVVDGQKLDMGDPQPLQMLHAEGKAALRILPGKGLEPAPILLRHAAVRIIGEVLHVKLINDVLRGQRRRGVPVKALRVGAGQIHRHAPPAVPAAGRGVGVGSTGGISLYSHLIVIINPVEVALYGARPHPPVLHLQQPVVEPGSGGIVLI